MTVFHHQVDVVLMLRDDEHQLLLNYLAWLNKMHRSDEHVSVGPAIQALVTTGLEDWNEEQRLLAHEAKRSAGGQQ